MKKLLPTSTAGSLPKPNLAGPARNFVVTMETCKAPQLHDGKQDALRLALHEQQQAGIDIVSDGEQSRQHFVTTFIEHLAGVDFAQAPNCAYPRPLRRQRADCRRAGVTDQTGVC